MSMLEQAVVTLSRLCDGASSHDGQGFNKFDSAFGHSLASQANDWTFPQARAAYQMLRKYRVQLAGLGVHYDEIPEPREGEYRAKISDAKTSGKRQMVRKGKYLHLSWQEYSRELADEIKKLPGAKWSKADRAWKIKISPVNLAAAINFASKHEFSNVDKAKEMYDEFADEARLRYETSTMAGGDPLPIEERMTMPLRPFQRAGIQYATRTKRCMIADEMGLGKTVQSIVSVETLEAYPCICVVPAVVKEKWHREWHKWFKDRDISVEIVSGRKPYSLKSPLYGYPEVVIINFDILSYWKEELKKMKPQAIIFDESHYLKNGKAKRTRAAINLAAKIPHVYLLTGTPIENKTIEFASQLKVMGRLEDLGGWRYFAYHWAGAKDGPWGIEYEGGRNLEELNACLRSLCYVRRLKQDVAKDLPEKARCIEEVEIDNKDEYQRVQERFLEWVADKALTQEFMDSIADLDPEEKEVEIRHQRYSAATRASMAEMLVQLGALRKTVALGKINAARKWIENFIESGEKLIVFGWHRQIVEDLADIFNSPKIVGGMKAEDRQGNADKFMNDPDCKLIFCNLKAAGVGVDLYAASNVLFLELGWTPTVHDQAEARAHRIGQTKNVMSWYLLADGTIDDHMYQLLEEKRQIVEAATDGETTRGGGTIVKELVKSLLSQNKESEVGPESE